MKRREFLVGVGLVGGGWVNSVRASLWEDKFESAVQVLQQATESGQLQASALYARVGTDVVSRFFGGAKSENASFLLGSITKPIAITSLMILFSKGKFKLDQPVRDFLPEFHGGKREQVTIRHLLTHVSGLPDQLPENAELRASHSPLSSFVKGAMKVPLHFEPGTQYEYSSMGILLASEIAQRITGRDIKELVNETVLKPLRMSNSALGMGSLKREQIMPCQVEFGAIEAGGGSPDSKSWDWNSEYWRGLGAPWGGGHASAPDIARWLDEFLKPSGKLFPEDVSKIMIRNQNPDPLTPRGLGFDVGLRGACPQCSSSTFGHTGSTGTIAWADPLRDRICVVLTTLPGRALPKHPRQVVSDRIAAIA